MERHANRPVGHHRVPVAIDPQIEHANEILPRLLLSSRGCHVASCPTSLATAHVGVVVAEDPVQAAAAALLDQLSRLDHGPKKDAM